MQLTRIALVFLFLLSELAQARTYLWPLLLKGRGERTEEQAMELRGNQFPSVSASFTVEEFIFSLETSRFENESSDGNVSIATRYSDLSAWGGYHLFNFEQGSIYALVGLGSYEQKVESSVGNVTTQNSSSQKMLSGAGLEYLLETDFYLALAAGARLIWTEDLDPETMPELYLKIGIGF